MSGITITRQDFRGLDKLIAETPQQAEKLLDSAAQGITSDVQLSFGASVSSPGDPPGVDTGALRASMGWSSDGPLKRNVHDGVNYGIHLEYGTEYMAPRPFMQPVFEDWRRHEFAALARRMGLLEP